jgi:hypothetical protein
MPAREVEIMGILLRPTLHQLQGAATALLHFFEYGIWILL